MSLAGWVLLVLAVWVVLSVVVAPVVGAMIRRRDRSEPSGTTRRRVTPSGGAPRG